MAIYQDKIGFEKKFTFLSLSYITLSPHLRYALASKAAYSIKG